MVANQKNMDYLVLPIYNRCNNQCLMCTNTDFKKMLHAFDYKGVVDYLENELKNNLGFLHGIGITGGETTIAPHFFQVMSYIRLKFPRLKIDLLTNGRMLIYPEFRQRCLGLGNINFVIPIHGYNAKTHDKITRVTGSFKQTMLGIKKLFEERLGNQEIELRVIATRLNLKIIPRIFELIKSEFPNVDRVVLIFPEFEGMASINLDRVAVTFNDLLPVLKKIKRYFYSFREVRLYHFPLCVLEPFFWPYTWRTLPEDEIAFLPACKLCLMDKYCLGVHKSYLEYCRNPEIRPFLSLKRFGIVADKNSYRPISSVKVLDKA